MNKHDDKSTYFHTLNNVDNPMNSTFKLSSQINTIINPYRSKIQSADLILKIHTVCTQSVSSWSFKTDAARVWEEFTCECVYVWTNLSLVQVVNRA